MPPTDTDEHSHFLPNHQQRSDHVPTAQPSAASSFAAGEETIPCVEEDACSAANKIIVTASLSVLAIASLAMAFTAISFLPPMPSVTLDSVSGSVVLSVPGSASDYAIEDFAATFSIRNVAEKGMVCTGNRVNVEEITGKHDYDTTTLEFTEVEPRSFELGGGGDSLTVQFALPNMTVKVNRWALEYSGINDPASAVGVSTLSLNLISRARYRGKAWPKQISLYSTCGEIVARLVAVSNATRRVELDYNDGKDCDTNGTWLYLKLYIVMFNVQLALAIPAALRYTFRRVKSNNNNKSPV